MPLTHMNMHGANSSRNASGTNKPTAASQFQLKARPSAATANVPISHQRRVLAFRGNMAFMVV